MSRTSGLPTLPHLKGLPVPKARVEELKTGEPHVIRQAVPTLDEQPTPPGWESWENWRGYLFLSKIDPRWLPEWSVEGIKTDAFHPWKKTVVFFDGSWTHREALQATDETKRAGLSSQGYRVTAYRFTTRQDFLDGLAEWYDRELGW